MRTTLRALCVSLFLLGAFPAFAASEKSNSQAVAYVLQHGLMHVDGAGSFNNDAPVTRYQLLRLVLAQAYSKDDPSLCYWKIASRVPPRFSLLFRDVSALSPSAPIICVGMVAGLVGGSSDGNFRGTDAITTAEASKILARAYDLYTIGSTEPKGAPWYQTYMWVLRKHGALPASADDAGHTLTRSEVAEMLYGLRDRMVTLGDHTLEAAQIVQSINGNVALQTPPTQETSPVPALIIAPSAPKAPYTSGSSLHRAERSNARAQSQTTVMTIRGVSVASFMGTAK